MVENLQRDIDIALTNELAMVLPMIGVDVEDVLAAADTKWNFHRHSPGIGVGGHCIPVDPYYYISLAESVGYDSILSKTARRINEGMPDFSVKEIQKLLGLKSISGKRILVLGYSYKPNVGDIRETPVENLVKGLKDNGAHPIIWDSLIDPGEFPLILRYAMTHTEYLTCW